MLGVTEQSAVFSIWLLLLLFFHQPQFILSLPDRSLFTMWARWGCEVRGQRPAPGVTSPRCCYNISGFTINWTEKINLKSFLSSPPGSIWMVQSCKKMLWPEFKGKLGGRGKQWGGQLPRQRVPRPEHRRLIWHEKWFPKLKRSLKICWQSPH